MVRRLAEVFQDKSKFDSDRIEEALEHLLFILKEKDSNQNFPLLEHYSTFLMSSLEDKRIEPENQLLAAKCLIELYKKNPNGILSLEKKEEILKKMVDTLKPLPNSLNASLEKLWDTTVALLEFLANCRDSRSWPAIFDLFCDFFWHQKGMHEAIFCICCRVFNSSIAEINQDLLSKIRNHYFSTIHKFTVSELKDALPLALSLANGTNMDDCLKECIYFFLGKKGWQRNLQWQYHLVSLLWVRSSEEAQNEFLFSEMTGSFLRFLVLGGDRERPQTMQFLIELFNSSRMTVGGKIAVENNTRKLLELFDAISDNLIEEVKINNNYDWDRIENQGLALDCFKSIKQKTKGKRETFDTFVNWMIDGMEKVNNNN